MTPPADSLWVMRHGESTWNAAGRTQRQIAHPPLTTRGLNQAFAAAKALRDKHIECIVASDAVRATQTAQAMSSVLHVPMSVDARFRERGLSGPDVLEDPTYRVASALCTIAATGARTVVVTHGDIVCLIRDMLAARTGEAAGWLTGSDVPNGAVLQVSLHALRNAADPA